MNKQKSHHLTSYSKKMNELQMDVSVLKRRTLKDKNTNYLNRLTGDVVDVVNEGVRRFISNIDSPADFDKKINSSFRSGLFKFSFS